MNGKAVWSALSVSCNSLSCKIVEGANLKNGMYILSITRENNELIAVQKIIIEK
jgi:hypothetical protein